MDLDQLLTTDEGPQASLAVNNYDLQIKQLFEVEGSIASNCLKILPLEPKRKFQKFVVGSQQIIDIWECKKGEISNSFKSVPQTKTDSQQISRVVISKAGEDKFYIFYCVGQSIKGITKKGKDFFTLETSHTEVISSLHVQGQTLWSAGEYILNCYESSADNVMKDKYYYICDDKINDLVVASVAGQMVLNPIMAC